MTSPIPEFAPPERKKLVLFIAEFHYDEDSGEHRWQWRESWVRYGWDSVDEILKYINAVPELTPDRVLVFEVGKVFTPVKLPELSWNTATADLSLTK